MTDTDPNDVLQQYNSRIGKTRDPFARLKLKELRDNLKQTLEQVQALKRQYRLVQAGAEDVGGEWADGQLQQVGSSLSEANEKARQMAEVYAELLEVSNEDDTVELDEYLQEKQKEVMKKQREQLARQPGGPLQ